MADNITIVAVASAGGFPVGTLQRSRDRAGVQTQITALDLNPAGAEHLMSFDEGMPVSVIGFGVGATIRIEPGDDPLPAAPDSDVVYSGITPLTPKFASINALAGGDNTLVAAVIGKRIRVLRYVLIVAGPVSLKFRSGVTDLTGLMGFLAGGMGGGYCPVGHFETAAGQPLVLNLSAGVAVTGCLTFIEVPGA
jgi:hypothetical protein